MTLNEWKKTARVIKEAYKRLESEAVDSGLDIFSDDFQKIKDQAREKILANFGFTIEEYRAVRDSLVPANKKKVFEEIADIRQQLEEVKTKEPPVVPTLEEIKSAAHDVAHEVAKQYIKAPVVTNQIVKETVVEKPQIIETVRIMKESYDDKKLMADFANTQRAIKELEGKLSPALQALKEELKAEWSVDFGDNFKKNINMFDMPDWRKLAMGLQGQIDELKINPGLNIGDTIGSLTAGSILFGGVGGALAQDNANFFWDDTNNRLGIGTNTPGTIFHIHSATDKNLVVSTQINGTDGMSLISISDSLLTLKSLELYASTLITGMGGGVVGIGTATPASKLGIAGNLSVGSTYSSSVAAPTDGAVIQGYVGIGQTNPTTPLHISTLVPEFDSASALLITSQLSSVTYDQFGARYTPFIIPPSATSQLYGGLDLIAVTVSTTNHYLTNASVFGFRGGVFSADAGLVGTATGLQILQLSVGGGSFTTAYGINVRQPFFFSGGGVTNNIGVYIEDMDVGSGLNYSLYTNVGQIHLGDKVVYYNGVAAVGWGLPGIYGRGRLTGQTAAAGSVATYTVGASDGSFVINANVLVTTATTHNFSVRVDYTDEGNTARSQAMTFSNTAGGITAAIVNTSGAIAYCGLPVQIRAKASTSITVTTTGTFTTVTYNVEGTITQIA